jgi:flagellar basal-body rod modification protein FlgD
LIGARGPKHSEGEIMATSGIWNHAAAASISLANANPITGAKPMAGASGNTSASSTDSGATISANDFLSLLVTEMQNQDPTATTDPNEYINQLVNVNSLEQLIQINQTLTGDVTPSSAAPATGAAAATSAAAGTGAAQPSSAANPASGAQPGLGSHSAGFGTDAPSTGSTFAPAPVSVTSGNLAVPRANPAAVRVAQSLGGRSHIR